MRMGMGMKNKMEMENEMENKAEEGRMKGLAKSTLNMVLDQWRKAIYVSTALFRRGTDELIIMPAAHP